MDKNFDPPPHAEARAHALLAEYIRGLEEEVESYRSRKDSVDRFLSKLCRSSSEIGAAEHLVEVLGVIHQTLLRMEKLMTTSLQDFKDAFARVDTATTAIAARLKALSDGLAGMTPAEEEEAQAQLNALAATLEAMAANPDDPVPVDLPAEPTTP